MTTIHTSHPPPPTRDYNPLLMCSLRADRGLRPIICVLHSYLNTYTNQLAGGGEGVGARSNAGGFYSLFSLFLHNNSVILICFCLTKDLFFIFWDICYNLELFTIYYFITETLNITNTLPTNALRLCNLFFFRTPSVLVPHGSTLNKSQVHSKR